MKLHEIISARYSCKFPARYNKPAIEYYRTHSYGTQCLFIFDNMIHKNDFSLCNDDIQFFADVPNVWPELFEAFLYVAYEDIKKNHKKPKNLVIILDDET